MAVTVPPAAPSTIVQLAAVLGLPVTWSLNCTVRPAWTWMVLGATEMLTVAAGGAVVTWEMELLPGWVT